MKFANCHFHSTHSDGQFRPMHLARMAVGMGYRAAVLTDHDVTSGNTEFLREAQSLGLIALPGVEITCRLPEKGFHLVGLGIDLECPALKAFIDRLCDWRNVHTRLLFENGVREGLLRDITWDEVEAYNPGCRWFCNEQVFRAMELKGVFDILEQDKYFQLVFHGEFARAHRIEEPTAAEAISVIRRADGIPILAHPHRQARFVPELVELGLLGIEVCHPDLDETDEKLAREAAAAYGLYRSGGSDHSGVMGGCCPPYTAEGAWGADEEDFMAMARRIKR
ncbi:MAG: PHP domain-containing protein [Eubacteriales bacterium]|nr:PHP domain-containing protein [Eubacteriales bacterium]